MLSIGNIRYNLKHCNVKKVSSDTGIAYSTLANINSGFNLNPTYKVIEKLSEYFSIGQQK